MESGSPGAKFLLKILWLHGCECIGNQDDKPLFFAYVQEKWLEEIVNLGGHLLCLVFIFHFF